jgi:hypothetical protein
MVASPVTFFQSGWGMGMGGGYGSPLLTSLLAGGVGYALGSNSTQQSQPYPYPYQAPPQMTPDMDSGKLAQLKLLGELRDSGVLLEDEFERQKQRILNS